MFYKFRLFMIAVSIAFNFAGIIYHGLEMDTMTVLCAVRVLAGILKFSEHFSVFDLASAPTVLGLDIHQQQLLNPPRDLAELIKRTTHTYGEPDITVLQHFEAK